MESNEKQGELFEPDEVDSKDEIAKWNLRIAKAKAEKLETDNALRNGRLVYADKAVESFQTMLNIVYGSLQAILSESLPYELLHCETTGAVRDRLASCYNEVIGKGREAFENFLQNQNGLKPEVGGETENAEPAA